MTRHYPLPFTDKFKMVLLYFNAKCLLAMGSIIVLTYLSLNLVIYSNSLKEMSIIAESAQQKYEASWGSGDYDAKRVVNLTDFRFHIRDNICGSPDIFLIILVHSAPSHFNLRHAIRETWGNQHLGEAKVRTAFLLGEVSDPKLNLSLREESAKYHDIVMGNFIDDYRNLTYKHIMGMHWASTYCSHVKYVMKSDDDVFVDIFQLVNFLHNYNDSTENALFCRHMYNFNPERQVGKKWYVTWEEYSGNSYPIYCLNWATIMEPIVARKLAMEAQKVPFFWIDDVYVTGILADRLQLRRISLDSYFTLESRDLEPWAQSGQNLLANYWVTTTNVTSIMRRYFMLAEICAQQRCVDVYVPTWMKVLKLVPVLLLFVLVLAAFIHYRYRYSRARYFWKPITELMLSKEKMSRCSTVKFNMESVG